LIVQKETTLQKITVVCASKRVFYFTKTSEHWLSYFDEMKISVQGGDGKAIATLIGKVVDQAALQGMLQKFYTLGLVLVQVQRKMKEKRMDTANSHFGNWVGMKGGVAWKQALRSQCSLC
jgi:hypothetical protein